MYYIPQVSKSGCGFACLKMLLASAHKDERYLYLKEDERHGSYSFQELVAIAQRYDVTLVGVKYEDKGDLRHLTRFPLILSVKTENDSLHAVLVVKRKGRKIKILDPAKGIYYEKIDHFIKRWDGMALAINQVQERAFTNRVIDVSDPKGEVLSYILQAFAAAFIALATFFVKPDGSFVWPLVFCAASVICEILLRMYLLRRMQKCDRYLRRFIPYVNRKDYFEYYRRSQYYKSSALTMGLNFIFYLLVVILIVTISLINSTTFIVSIGAALLAAFIEVFFFIPFKKTVNKELEEQEKELRYVKEEDDMEMKVKSMEVKSYRYAYLEFSSKVVVGAFFLVASFFISIIDHTLALTNIVFYICVSFLIYQYLVPLFSYDYKVSDNRIAKARINNLIHQNDENNGNNI